VFWLVKKRGAKGLKPVRLMEPETKSSKLLPLALVILVLAILFGATLLFSRVDLNGNSYEESRIELDHSLVKVLLNKGGSTSQELRVMNVGDDVESISVSSNLGGLLSLSDSSFEISPGQTKVLTLEFSSAIADVEYIPGVYSGYVLVEGSDYSVELPIVLDIESEEVLFDSSLSFTNTDYEAGDSFSLPVRIYNLISEEQEATNVLFEYTIKDLAGNLVYSGGETVLVDGQASLSSSVELSSNLNPGYYVVGTSVSYAGSVGVSSEVIDIDSPEEVAVMGLTSYCGGSLIFCSLSVIIFIILLFFIGIFVVLFFRSRIKGENKVSQKEVSGFGGSMSLYLLVGLLIFFVLLLIVFVSGLVSYPSFISIFSAIPLSVYILLFVLVLVFLGVVLFKDLQSVQTKSYYHKVERLKQSIEIEKYQDKLDSIKAKKGEFEEKGWFTKWKEEKQRKRNERIKLETELAQHKESLEKQKFYVQRKQEEEALKLKLKLEKQKLAEAETKSLEEQKRKKVFRKKISSIVNVLPNYLRSRKERKEKEKTEKQFGIEKAKKEKLKFEAALVDIKNLHDKESVQFKEKDVFNESEDLVMTLPVRKIPTKVLDQVIDPWERCNKLLGFCYKALNRKDHNKVEMYYSEIKPLFLHLERWQKQRLYPRLVELQNDMAMLHMNSLRTGLEPLKKGKK
jgi:hypothetical protein